MREDMGASAKADPALVASDQAPSGLAPTGFDPLRFEWRVQTAKYTHGKNLLLGGIVVGSADYDGVSSKKIAERYRITTRLPGVRPKVDRFAKEEDACRALERVTYAWFAKTAPALMSRTTPVSDAPSAA